jgi:hypothetical protein
MAVQNLNTGALAEQLGGFQTLATAGDSLRNSELAATEESDTFISPIPLAQLNTGALGEQLVGPQIVATAGDGYRNSFVLAQESADTTDIVATASVTGTLSVAEVGDDTCDAAGNTQVSGVCDLAEVGDDTLVGAGTVEVLGVLDATDLPDVFTGVATVEVRAVFSAHEEDNDTLAAMGGVEVSGSVATTEAQDTIYVLGNVIAQGDKDASEAPDTAIGDGGVLVQGDCDILEPNDTFAGQAVTRVTGVLAATEAQDIFVATGIVLNPEDIIRRKQGRSLFRGMEDGKATLIGRRTTTAAGKPAVVVINPWTGVPEIHGHGKAMALRSWTRTGRVVATTGGGAQLTSAVARSTGNLTTALGVARQVALGRSRYKQAIDGDGTARVYGGIHGVMFNHPDAVGVTRARGAGQFHVTSAGFSTGRGQRQMPKSYKVVAAARLKSRKVIDSLPV